MECSRSFGGILTSFKRTDFVLLILAGYRGSLFALGNGYHESVSFGKEHNV